jgi:hypothetical protein
MGLTVNPAGVALLLRETCSHPLPLRYITLAESPASEALPLWEMLTCCSGGCEGCVGAAPGRPDVLPVLPDENARLLADTTRVLGGGCTVTVALAVDVPPEPVHCT